MRTFIFLLISCEFVFAIAQRKTAYHQYMAVEENETLLLSQDTIIVDTLIMRDNSTLTFESDTYLQIQHGYLGSNVSFSSQGVDGSNGRNGDTAILDGENGLHGIEGKSLAIVVNFEALGSLHITTVGGKGGKGGDGYSSPRLFSLKISINRPIIDVGIQGGNGGNGGRGGDGGDINLMYSTSGFVPVFNRNRKEHVIHLVAKGGNGGKGGKGGKGYEPTGDTYVSPVTSGGAKGSNGLKGFAETAGSEGKIIIRKMTSEIYP